MDDILNETLRDQHEVGLVRLLHYGDAISMAHSLESRPPFMDYRLGEFALSLPGHFKLRDGYEKVELRRALRDAIPKDILSKRSKLAFRTPIERWFREDPEDTLYGCSNRRPVASAVFSIPKPWTTRWNATEVEKSICPISFFAG